MLRAFWKQGILLLQRRSASSSRLSVKVNRIYGTLPTRLNRDNRRPANIAFSVPFAVTPSRNINLFPSTTPFGLAYGVDSPLHPD